MRHIPASKVGLFRYLLDNDGKSGIVDPIYHQMLKLELRRLFKYDKKGRWSKVVDHFQKLVSQHYRTERALAFYASHLCISENHLYKIVKQTTGRTPSGIIQGHLIQEAIFYLEYTDQGLKEIAFNLSFKEVAYFIRFFKKHIGTTPGQYRKLLIDQQDLSNDRQDMYYNQRTEGT